jgi:uncharacterized membrane protein
MEALKLAGKCIVIIGLVIVSLGIIFKLQSESLLGPSSSFMYSDPTWTTNGYILIAIGLGFIVVGVIMRYYYSSKR